MTVKTIIYNLLFFICSVTFAQELPPIVKYQPETYHGGNQNWMISQNKDNYVFFANNDGLLEYNGSSWQLYPSPNNAIIRSVKVIGDRIYTGTYMDFGFWKRASNGQLIYFSLAKKIKNKIVDEEQFWNILNYDQWVLFQSLNRIYIYDSKSDRIEIIQPKFAIIKSFSVNNSIYFQTVNDGLYELESGKIKVVSNNPIIQKNRIVNIFSTDGGLLIQTQNNGFYTLINSQLSKFSTEVDSSLSETSVYSSQALSNGGFAIGTVSKGVYIVTKEGKLRYHISQTKGLSNNTALSLFEDSDKNLWVGLDNGINCLNLESPIRNYVDKTGVLGTIYASKLFHNILYVGTNQGLFYKIINGGDDFKFINGTKGQVWSLFEYDDTLFCGHDLGTYVINDGTAKAIFSSSGTWKFSNVPRNKSMLIQGNYYGLSVLKKINNDWVFSNKISGFNFSSRHFEISDQNDIYVAHEYKGVFRLQCDSQFLKVNSFVKFQNPTKGKNAGLAKYNHEIYYANQDGIFKLNSKLKEFKKDSILSTVFTKDRYKSGKIVIDDSNKIWIFSKNYIHYFSQSKVSDKLKENVIPIPSSLTNSMSGFENISQISNSTYLIGTTDGYYTININDLSFNNYAVSIYSVLSNKLNSKYLYNKINEKGDFSSDENNIAFGFTVPEYNQYVNFDFQYSLEGFQDDWSEWSSRTSTNFKNLPPGDYTFKVRAKFTNSILKDVETYSFTIRKPWYSTNLAMTIYILVFFYFTYFVNKMYKKYYRNKEAKLIEENNLLLEIKELENEQQLMRVRNEKLSQDVDVMNKELAVSAMDLNSKNELLTFIREDLKNTNIDENRSIKSVISTINKNITGNDSWNVFKEAFENTDKDFLKKVKQLHPSLTPNDLRLCAYLRLNLSSKEIAPLLNISVRSVEIKRYRLRKKMELAHEQGLAEYILNL